MNLQSVAVSVQLATSLLKLESQQVGTLPLRQSCTSTLKNIDEIDQNEVFFRVLLRILDVKLKDQKRIHERFTLDTKSHSELGLAIRSGRHPHSEAMNGSAVAVLIGKEHILVQLEEEVLAAFSLTGQLVVLQRHGDEAGAGDDGEMRVCLTENVRQGECITRRGRDFLPVALFSQQGGLPVCTVVLGRVDTCGWVHRGRGPFGCILGGLHFTGLVDNRGYSVGTLFVYSAGDRNRTQTRLVLVVFGSSLRAGRGAGRREDYEIFYTRVACLRVNKRVMGDPQNLIWQTTPLSVQAHSLFPLHGSAFQT